LYRCGEANPYIITAQASLHVFFMSDNKKIGCVIMASGEGKRFGSNKLLADFRGRSLFTYIFDATDIPGLERVVVTRYRQIADEAENLKIAAILHNLPYISDTIRLGTDFLRECDSIIFCPSDQPHLSRMSMIKLIELGQKNPESICRLSFNGTVGSPVLFPSSYFGDLMSLSGEESGRDVIKRHGAKVLYVEASSAEELIDIDTRQDFENL